MARIEEVAAEVTENNLNAPVSALQDAVLATVEQFSVHGAYADYRRGDDETHVIIKRQEA